MKIAFVGLGAMGYPMAGHLAKNHDVIVWNRTAEVAERHAKEHRTTHVATLADCAAADAIITIVPTSREVDEIVDQVIEKVRPGTLWIDATSGDPVASRATAARLAARQVAFVDAPVTGGTPGAIAGTLTVMIGGTKENFARARAICESYGKKIAHVGEVGAGHAIKAVNNAMMAANMLAAAEGLLSLKRFGFDMATALEVLNAGSGRSNVTENLLPKRIIDGEWPLTFKLSLLDKDVRIAASVAHSQHLATPMLALTSQLYTAALKELGMGADYIEVAKFVAGLNGERW
jgi:3-hydroxyisobutyrate dehydrogenase